MSAYADLSRKIMGNVSNHIGLRNNNRKGLPRQIYVCRRVVKAAEAHQECHTCRKYIVFIYMHANLYRVHFFHKQNTIKNIHIYKMYSHLRKQKV